MSISARSLRPQARGRCSAAAENLSACGSREATAVAALAVLQKGGLANLSQEGIQGSFRCGCRHIGVKDRPTKARRVEQCSGRAVSAAKEKARDFAVRDQSQDWALRPPGSWNNTGKLVRWFFEGFSSDGIGPLAGVREEIVH